jgi:hypothetical protein
LVACHFPVEDVTAETAKAAAWRAAEEPVALFDAD